MFVFLIIHTPRFVIALDFRICGWLYWSNVVTPFSLLKPNLKNLLPLLWANFKQDTKTIKIELHTLCLCFIVGLLFVFKMFFSQESCFNAWVHSETNLLWSAMLSVRVFTLSAKSKLSINFDGSTSYGKWKSCLYIT